jgi:alkylation response protein AidB-like acyl-CoA dehydrogenase
MVDSEAPAVPADRPGLADYRRQARAWLAGNLETRDGPAREYEIDHFTPEVVAANRARQRKLFDGGYAGITWPEQFGGQGLPAEYEEAFLAESAGFVTPDFGLLGDTTFGSCVPTMLAHAPAQFLQRFVPRVLAGEALVCQFFSEPGAGSDLAAARTRATRSGDEWVIDGQKVWSSWAQLADWGMCLARTNWDVPKHQGLTWFAVPCDAPGLTIRPIRQITGETDFCEDFFDDVRVPDADRISEVDDGWAVAQTMLVFERGAGRAGDAAALGGPGPIAPDLVQLARAAGRLADPVVRQKIARAHTNDFVGRALRSRIGQLGQLGRLNPGLAAYGKLFAGTYQPLRAAAALEIGGAASVTWDAAVPGGSDTAASYLNGRRWSIAGGTNEMQRNAIAERALGLPREPNPDTSKPFSEVLRNAASWRGSA